MTNEQLQAREQREIKSATESAECGGQRFVKRHDFEDGRASKMRVSILGVSNQIWRDQDKIGDGLVSIVSIAGSWLGAAFATVDAVPRTR